MSDITFADGFTFERREGAPDFVVGRLSIKANLGKIFIDTYANERGFINLNIKQSKKGGYYIELDTWKPNMNEKKEWQPIPQTQAQIDEVANIPKRDYPVEELGDSPF